MCFSDELFTAYKGVWDFSDLLKFFRKSKRLVSFKANPFPLLALMLLWKEPLLKVTLNWNTLRLKCDTKVFMSFFTFDINPFTLFPTYAPLAWLLSKELKDMNVCFQTLNKSSRFKKGNTYSETFITTNDQLCSAQNSTISMILSWFNNSQTQQQPNSPGPNYFWLYLPNKRNHTSIYVFLSSLY